MNRIGWTDLIKITRGQVDEVSVKGFILHSTIDRVFVKGHDGCLLDLIKTINYVNDDYLNF